MSLIASSLHNATGRLAAGADPRSQVLHICSDYPGSPVFHELIAHLPLERRRRTAVYVPLRHTHRFLGQHTYEKDAAPVLYSRDYSEFDRLFFHRKCSRIASRVRAQVNLAGVGLIHAHYLFAGGGVAYALKRSHDIPYVVAVRNSDVNVYFKLAPHLRTFGIDLLLNAEAVFFLSPKYRDRIITTYLPDRLRADVLAKSAVIPSGINDFWFTNRLQLSRRQPARPIKLLYMGELTKNKNIEGSIAAVLSLRDRGVESELTIVGTGSHEGRIAKLADRHRDYIHMHGWISSWNERLDMFRAADVFIMPSFRETFGLVYLEAMSQGLPVIYTRGEGIDGHFAQGEVGYACDPTNPTEMADRLQDILSNYGCISDAARAAIDICQWSRVTDHYEKAYEAIIPALPSV